MTTDSQHIGLPRSERIGQQTIEDQHGHSHHGDTDSIHMVAGGEATHRPLNAAAVGAHHRPQLDVLPRVWRFVLHFVEMCVVMCLGAGILGVLLGWGGSLIGYPEPKRQFPELSTLVLALYLSLLMITWMRFRGHEWRPTLEMAGTSIVVMIPLFAGARLGVVPKSSLFALLCGLACAAMLVPMLFRRDLYTGHHAGHSRHALPKTKPEV